MYLHCQHTGNNTVFGYAIKLLLKCYLKIFIIICIPNMLYFGGSSLWHHPTGPCNRGHINIDTWIYLAIVLNGKWQTLLYHCCIWDQKGRLDCTISAALKVVKLTALSAREMRRWQSFRLLSLSVNWWLMPKQIGQNFADAVSTTSPWYQWVHFLGKMDHRYCQISNIGCTLVGNKFVHHSDVVGASPVGAAPTTSSFST